MVKSDLEQVRPDGSTARPLVVAIDDDASVLSAISRVLQGEPYDFVATNNPDEVLDLVRTRRVDLVLADYRMPVLSGTSLLQVVKATSPSTRRLLLTAYPRAMWVLRAQEKDVMDTILEKPWDNDGLRIYIRNCLLEQGWDGVA
jgi:DNA-binding NtrC family response regulator